MRRTADETVMKPYLKKLMREHRRLNRIIDNTKAPALQKEMQRLKQLRLRIKDKIVALQRHYYGRSALV